jgi:hypothetical protein
MSYHYCDYYYLALLPPYKGDLVNDPDSIERKDGKLHSINIRKRYIFYPYTVEEYNDPDTSKYVDEKGNDLRFGFDCGTFFI